MSTTIKTNVPTFQYVKEKYISPFAKREKSLASKTINEKERQKYYNSRAWRDYRRSFVKTHPICELSILSNNVRACEHLHHIVKFEAQPTEELRWMMLLDDDNVIALTKDKHMTIHYRNDELTESERALLDERKKFIFEKYLALGYTVVMEEDSNVKFPQKQ